jgi:6-phosphofructokinase 1
VQYAHFGDSKGQHTGSVTIHRTGFYSVEYHLTPLVEIAAKTKVMSQEFLSDNGHDVTSKFQLYLRPLLGSGFPESSRLRMNRVPKILKK